jgi:hypothetical protein
MKFINKDEHTAKYVVNKVNGKNVNIKIWIEL